MLRAERQVLSERRPHTKQIQKSKGHGGSAGRRQEPLAVDPRDPDIVHARRIAHLLHFIAETSRTVWPNATSPWAADEIG
jgi:hypothetical protein